LSVIGSLEDLAFPDVLQLIRASRRSGTLILSLRDGERRVHFNEGMIVDAVLGTGGPELGDLLRRRGQVDARTLAEARERARRTGERMAEVLVGMGALAQEAIEQAVRDELRASLRTVILAQEGEFRFELEEDRRPGSETVLLLAERTVVRRAILEELRRSGFEVIVCASSAEVLDHARRMAGSGAAFLVVSDLILPDSSGGGWAGGLDLLKSVHRVAPQAAGVLLGDLRARGDAAASAAGATAFVPLPDLGTTGLEGIGATLGQYARLVRDAALHPGRFSGPGNAARGPLLAVDHVTLLRGLVGELHSEEEVAIPLLVLRLAAEYLERGVLFTIRGGAAQGAGAFGEESDGSAGRLDRRVRDVVLPLAAGSALERAVRTGAAYIGPIDANDPNGRLIARLGGPPPRESALLPIAAGRQVFAVLYGDNARSGRPVGDLRGLEIFVAQAGIALHNAALKRRLSELSAAAGGSGAHA
jgi:CheY-like chemotaxis protein